MKRIKLYAFLSAICMILSACGEPLEPTPYGSQQRALPPELQNVKEEVIPQMTDSTIEWVIPPSLDYDDIRWAGAYVRENTMVPDIASMRNDTSLSQEMHAGTENAYKSFFVHKGNKYGAINSDAEVFMNVKYKEIGCPHCAIWNIIMNFPEGKDFDIMECTSESGHGGPRGFIFYDVKSKQFYDVADGGLYLIKDWYGNERIKYMQGTAIWNDEWQAYMIAPESWDNGKYGFVDNKGESIVPAIYKQAEGYSEDYAAVQADNEKWGFIDKQGDVLVECKYDYVGHFNEGYAVISNGDKWGYIDITGKEVVPPQFEGATEVVDGQCYIKENGLWGIAIIPTTEIVETNIQINGNDVKFTLPIITENGGLYLPAREIFAMMGTEYTKDSLQDVETLNKENEVYVCIDDVAELTQGRYTYEDTTNIYNFLTPKRIMNNAQEVGRLLTNLVLDGSAIIIYEPEIIVNNQKQRYKVVSLLGNGVLEEQNGNIVAKNLSTKVTEEDKEKVWGYYLDQNGCIVTDSLILAQLSTISCANWEYQLYKDGLNLSEEDGNVKQYKTKELNQQMFTIIDEAMKAINNYNLIDKASSVLESMAAASFSATISVLTFSPVHLKAGLIEGAKIALEDSVKGLIIDAGVGTTIDALSKGDSLDSYNLVYQLTQKIYDEQKSQREVFNCIVETAGNKYILTYENALDFLNSYYQMNATIKALKTCSEMYIQLIPESRTNFQAAFSNIAVQTAASGLLSDEFSRVIPSQQVAELLGDISVSGITALEERYDQTPKGFLRLVINDIAGEKTKLNNILYKNYKTAMAYQIVAY